MSDELTVPEIKEQIKFIIDGGPARPRLVMLWEFCKRNYQYGRDEAAAECRDEARNGVSPRAWQVIRTLVFQRDNYQCQHCGRETDSPQCDHVIPLSRGGTTTADNLVTACAHCNNSKGNKLLGEWLRGRYPY